jgi:hypothetical protein
MEMAMPTRRHVWRALAALPLINAFLTPRARAESAQSPSSGPGQMMLTINQHLKETGWFKDFPPPDVEVVSWYVMMGIGQVVTLRFPAERLREINRLVESEAWGAFRTEFYPTYDYRALRAQLVRQMG